MTTLILTAGIALAAPTPSPMPSPTLNPQPQGTEIAFVTGIQKVLMARSPTAADATKAGSSALATKTATARSATPTCSGRARFTTSKPALVRRQRQSAQRDFSVLQSIRWSRQDFGASTSDAERRSRAHSLHSQRAERNRNLRPHERQEFVAAGGSVTDPGAAALVKASKATSIAQVNAYFCSRRSGISSSGLNPTRTGRSPLRFRW